MIYIKDNFLSEPIYAHTLSHLLSNDYREVDTGEKSFWIWESGDAFDELVAYEISDIEKKPIRNILSFFRIATDEVDTDWRIHADTIINNEKPDRALVLYMSESGMDELHGTAFWSHKEMGDTQPKDVSDEEFDETLRKDSNNLDKWDLKSVVGYKPNRLLSYPCNYFHSKYPNKGWKDGRIVYVMFYKYAEH
jgi:hypothetical protein